MGRDATKQAVHMGFDDPTRSYWVTYRRGDSGRFCYELVDGYLSAFSRVRTHRGPHGHEDVRCTRANPCQSDDCTDPAVWGGRYCEDC